jgi:hypothetical protein
MLRGLVQYVLDHTERGACRCGQCIDAPQDPENRQPPFHTVDMVFFEVCLVGEPDPNVFRKLVADNIQGEFCRVDVLDGDEHGYIELGGWIGDQGVAMQFMALGCLLGLFTLFEPKALGITGNARMTMAQNGFMSVRLRRPDPC